MTRKTIAKFHSFRIRDIETKKKNFTKSNFRPSKYLYFSSLKGDLCIALEKDCVWNKKNGKFDRIFSSEIWNNMIHPNTQSLRPESPISGFSAKKFESVSVERILSTQMYCMWWWWKMMQFSSSKNRFLPVFVLFYIQSFFKAMHGPPFGLLK